MALYIPIAGFELVDLQSIAIVYTLAKTREEHSDTSIKIKGVLSSPSTTIFKTLARSESTHESESILTVGRESMVYDILIVPFQELLCLVDDRLLGFME
ncbi:hypothetical protein GJ744_000010 [Endocarpon pusillum]|uniref:Uncharacterized protein n=1 Tax=Endocarpon pusillum TaxID=364733 RepID=A0A8H7EA65_9EURO|nr:hypothetical protein GJ744_000010 [Endocarpon pusillum]